MPLDIELITPSVLAIANMDSLSLATLGVDSVTDFSEGGIVIFVNNLFYIIFF